MKIENPCSENYNSMQSTYNGRRCKACETTVIDFTHRSVSEIEDYLLNHTNEKICGRYKNYQVNTPTKTEVFLISIKEFIERKVSFKPMKLALLSVISGLLTFTTSCMGKRVPSVSERNKEYNDSYYYDSTATTKPDSLKKK